MELLWSLTMNRVRLPMFLALLVGTFAPVQGITAQATADSRQANAVEYFESQVRPLLVEHCQSCHGEKKQEAGLRLDSARGLKAGGDSGAVIVAGEPDKSALVEVVRYQGDIKMPPRGKLSDAAVATLERWVKDGAVWPESTSPSHSTDNLAEAARHHWAFQAIREPEIPAIKAQARVRTPVDTFILSKLEAAVLPLSSNVDRRTFIRRATFDLHGVPPTPEEVAQFEKDTSPDPFKNLIDRLLASPRYGERWGRYWLDVARYADTKGYVRLNENPRYPSSWTYRDYVIRAFNEDLPFDQFIVEQLAADLLPADPKNEEGHSSSLAALGFLTLGQRFLNSTPDIIDDRIDLISRGLIGLSVGCARCHSHKFDPVPIQDYYALYGVFLNSVEPREPPLILPRSQHSQYADYLKELKVRTDQLEHYLHEQHAALTVAMRTRVGEYLLAGQFDPVQANFLAVMFLIDAKKDLNPVMTQRWARYLAQSRKGHDPVLTPWHEMAQWLKQRQQENKNPSSGPVDQFTASDAFAAYLQEQIPKWQVMASPSTRVSHVVLDALSRSNPRSLSEMSQVYGDLLKQAAMKWEQSLQADASTTQLGEPEWEELRQLMQGERSPLTFPIEDVEDFLFVDTTTQQALHAEQRKVTDWIGSPGAAPHAMALEDVSHPVDSRVFLRGNASNPGEVVPRHFLTVLSNGQPPPFTHGSGRLELARAIASPDNPLTARVIANRVWLNHFGAGLVRTPSDFGLRGEKPTHPELLDYLAHSLISQGWSLKSLHRLIMLSETYRLQCSTGDEQMDQLVILKDPENTLLSHMNRRRLDWESLRDSLLSVSGQLDGTMGGPSVPLFKAPYSSRRTVYGLIDRQNLASELRTFDFVPPDASSPQRHQTTVPQQALFMMNSPFLKQQVRHLAVRLDAMAGQTPAARIEAAYRWLFARSATAAERELGIKYLSSPETTTPETSEDGTPLYLSTWEEYLQALLLSNEFVFVD